MSKKRKKLFVFNTVSARGSVVFRNRLENQYLIASTEKFISKTTQARFINRSLILNSNLGVKLLTLWIWFLTALAQVWTLTLISWMVVIIVADLILWIMMNLMMIIEAILPIVLDDIVDNLFRYYISLFLMHWLVISRCIFYFNSCSLLSVGNQVPHLTWFPPLSSVIGKSDTNKNTEYVV